MNHEPRHSATHGNYLPYLMNRVVGQINAPMQAELRRRGMTMTHWRVLGFLDERDGLIISDLADRTLTDQATLSRALDRLEDRGLLARRVVAEDSRRIRIHLNDAGRKLYRELARRARSIESWAFEGMTGDELQMLGATLAGLSARLSERAAGGSGPGLREAA